MTAPTEPDALKRYRDALWMIANYGHMYDCPSSAPVYECGCQPRTQAQIAQEALND